MNITILNRNFEHPADNWYMIEPKGEHPNRAAGVVQIIDDEASQSIVNRFNADAAAGALRHRHELLIDHEHFSSAADKESRAYGWLQELQNRDDGIYGRIRWTATGKAAVDGGDYRFFSTEYDPADLKVLNGGTPRRVRPLRLDGLSLTNMNNNRGQKPITNRGQLILNGDVPGHEFHGNQWAQGEAGAFRLEAHRQSAVAIDAPNHEAGALAGQRASDAANSASSAANNRGDQQSHSHAMVAHREARQAHESLAAMTDDKTEQRFHNAEAAKHAALEKEHAGKIGIRNRKNFAGAPARAANQPQQTQRTHTMKTIATKLGLAAEASEESILAAVTKLQNRNQELEPLGEENTKLKNRVTELDAEQCETLMDAHGLKSEKAEDKAKRERLKPVLVGLKNREDRQAFLKECVPVAAPPATSTQNKLHNRDGKQPGQKVATEEGDVKAQQATATKIMNRAHELVRQTPTLSLITATGMAQKEIENAG